VVERAHDYLDSPLNAADDDSAMFAAGPESGAPLPNVLLAEGDFLLDHLSARFALLVPADADLDAVQRLPLHTVRLPRHACERLGLQSKSAALLVRPDQHVCARWTTLSAPRLQAALARATALETVPC
jgi:3-(3-hydroxy-phenyl)propionate hydroxylase